MKKTGLILFAIFLMLSVQLKAQLGVHIGYNFAKINGPEIPTGVSEKYLSNLTGGAFFEKDIIPLLDIRVGLMYSPKGWYWEADADNSHKMIFNYLEMPVLAKLKVGPVYALGGFYGAYALNGKQKLELLGLESTTDIDFENDEFKKFDYGMKFGLGFQTGVGPVHIFAQGEYSFGLQNINDGEGDEMKNSVIGVSAGVLIGF